jgi:hypothetical protein
MASLLAKLQASQDAETAFYSALQSPGLTASQRTDLIRKINEQVAIRTAAYGKLSEGYLGRQKDNAILTDATTQQLQALQLVEHQLQKQKTALDDKRLQAIKMVEITSYSGQQYQAYAGFLASVAFIAILFVASNWAAARLSTKAPIANFLPRIVLLLGSLYLISRFFDLLLRRKDLFEEYAWPVAPRTLDDAKKVNTQTNKFIKVEGIPTLCAGSYCCADGTSWLDSKGCVVSASAPKKSQAKQALDGQELTLGTATSD